MALIVVARRGALDGRAAWTRSRTAVRPWPAGGRRQGLLAPSPESNGRQAWHRPANCAACGRDLCPASFMIAGTSGSDTKLCQPCSSQSKTTQTRSSSEGSRKMSALFEPCSLRLSAPVVEKISRKRSKSSTCVVASSIFISIRGGVCRCVRRCGGPPSGGEDRHVDEAFLRIHRPEVLDDLEPAAACLADVHAHAHVVLAGHH